MKNQETTNKRREKCFYSPLVKKASLISFEAHKNDYDKGGYPYVMHQIYLAFQMKDENAVCVALLHDVIENHGDRYSFDYLREEGFNEEILSALKLLTNDSATPYMDYIEAIGKNELARRVKIADLKHNLDTSRLDGEGFYKDEWYEQALVYLTQL